MCDNTDPIVNDLHYAIVSIIGEGFNQKRNS